jgi:hypothetical protein
MSGLANVKEEPDPLAAPGMANVKEEADPSAAPDEPASKRQRTDVPQLVMDHDQAGRALHVLLKEQKWDDVYNMIKKLRKRCGAARIPELDVLSDCGSTPLVYALECGAPSQVVKKMADEYTVTQQVIGLPDFPLHLACASKTLSFGTIETILDLYPKAILTTPGIDPEIGHPICIILQHKPSLKLIDKMVAVWADQSGTDEDECWRRILSKVDFNKMLPLHVALQDQYPTDLILKMVEKYPKSITEEIELNGLPPLHVAAFNGCSLEVLKALLKHASGMIGSKRGDSGDTPLHLLFRLDQKDRWVKNEEGMMPPHKMARHLIKTHAFHLKNMNRKVKGVNNRPANRAEALVTKTKNKARYTVCECADELKKELEKLCPSCPDELLTLLDEFKHFGNSHGCPLDDWKIEAP